MLSTHNNTIVDSHFFINENEYYPLFNPSLLIDYYSKVIERVPQDQWGNITKKVLAQKISRIYGEGYRVIESGLLLNGTQPIETACLLSVINNNDLTIFLNCYDRDSSIIETIQNAIESGNLGIADIERRVTPTTCEAYHIRKKISVHFIRFDNQLRVNISAFRLGRRGEKKVYSPFDLMFAIMFSKDLMQFVEFADRSDDDDTQVFSWGGASDYYTVFMHEQGLISKGATEYDSIFPEVETTAAYIFSKYVTLSECFPFHVSSSTFDEPECWIIERDDNSIWHFCAKFSEQIEGSLFYAKNKCVFFLSYDYSGILKSATFEQTTLNLEFYRSILEKFFSNYIHDFATVEELDNKYVEFRCLSLSNDDSPEYLTHQHLFSNETIIRADYTVNCQKIMADIALVTNRSVENSVILKLLTPLFAIDSPKLLAISSRIRCDMSKRKTVDAAFYQVEYYFNENSYSIKETDYSQQLASKDISKVCVSAKIVPGVYEKKQATRIVRLIQESVVKCLENKIVFFDPLKMHVHLLSAISTELFSIEINTISASLCSGLDQNYKEESKEKVFQASENSTIMKDAFLYLLETNLFLSQGRGRDTVDDNALSELISLAKWIIYLQNSSDLCFHTDSETNIVVLDDYRVDVELGKKYAQILEADRKRRFFSEPYSLKGDEKDKNFIKIVSDSFFKDTGVTYSLFVSVMLYLEELAFQHGSVHFTEPFPNVIQIQLSSAIDDFLLIAQPTTTADDVKKAFDYLTIDPSKLKSTDKKEYPILPIWEREKRPNCVSVKPLFRSNDDTLLYSPIMVHRLRTRWESGLFQFFPPYESGLEKTMVAIADWKQHYEHLFSADVEALLKSSGFDYCKHDVDIRREDREGKHPTINELGDYDVIGLNIAQKTIVLVECKVLQPAGSVFEQSNQQKRFFQEEKFDEKFQRRIDYFSAVYQSFFNNIGFPITDDYRIQPYMVTNKVFSSYFKSVAFPIVTYNELISLLDTNRYQS